MDGRRPTSAGRHFAHARCPAPVRRWIPQPTAQHPSDALAGDCALGCRWAGRLAARFAFLAKPALERLTRSGASAFTPVGALHLESCLTSVLGAAVPDFLQRSGICPAALPRRTPGCAAEPDWVAEALNPCTTSTGVGGKTGHPVLAMAVLAHWAPLAQCAPRLSGESKAVSWRTQTPFCTTASTEQPTERWLHAPRKRAGRACPVPGLRDAAANAALRTRQRWNQAFFSSRIMDNNS